MIIFYERWCSSTLHIGWGLCVVYVVLLFHINSALSLKLELALKLKLQTQSRRKVGSRETRCSNLECSLTKRLPISAPL